MSDTVPVSSLCSCLTGEGVCDFDRQLSASFRRCRIIGLSLDRTLWVRPSVVVFSAVERGETGAGLVREFFASLLLPSYRDLLAELWKSNPVLTVRGFQSEAHVDERRPRECVGFAFSDFIRVQGDGFSARRPLPVGGAELFAHAWLMWRSMSDGSCRECPPVVDGGVV